jgi:pilus assembly protein CpaF
MSSESEGQLAAANGHEVAAHAGVAGPVMDAYYRKLGPLEALQRDNRVTEIMVLRHNEIYVEVGGQLFLTDKSFQSEDELVHLIHFIAGSIGRRVDNTTPTCDARLADGSRVNAVVRPVAIDGAMLTIRKFSKGALTVSDLVRIGTCTPEGFAFLEACVLATSNTLISGGTGAGKTTLLNVLSQYIPETERIVTIEDAAELKLHQRHVARLESQPADQHGNGAVTIRALVINALRMRPDRIVVGEVRGPEALDMLQAMNTGHDGSMSTIHANKPRDALARLETLVLMAGYDLPVRAIRQQVAGAIHILVHLERLRDGSRKITHISEIAGMEEDTITMQDIFLFRTESIDKDGKILGSLMPTGLRPRILDRLTAAGVPIPPELAQLFPAAVSL